MPDLLYPTQTGTPFQRYGSRGNHPGDMSAAGEEGKSPGATAGSRRPATTHTFLFTDIVRSVELKREMPGRSDAERDQAFIELVLLPHRERIERELAALGGRVVSTAGDGHFLVFADTISAARWAVGIQRAHREEPIRTPRGGEVAVRVSMHLGIPQLDPSDPNNFATGPSFPAGQRSRRRQPQNEDGPESPAIRSASGLRGARHECRRPRSGRGPMSGHAVAFG